VTAEIERTLAKADPRKESEIMSKLFATARSLGGVVGSRLNLESGFFCLIVAATLILQGCSTTPKRLPAVPPEVTAKAEIPGMPGVRYTAGIDIPELTEAAFQALARERDYLAQQGHKGPMPPAVYVAISGGGDNGAFAAGLLNAWTATGTRPEFKLVTGISTGALIAPFAFLGPKYDATLKECLHDYLPKRRIETA